VPTSFSRILNEDDLAEVRSQYLAALEALEAEELEMDEARPEGAAERTTEGGAG
jgi:hypothetical protein